jgi:hypothetical protein
LQICGDNWADPTPRKHELGGQMGEGLIMGTYTQGNIIRVTIRYSEYYFNKNGYY